MSGNKNSGSGYGIEFRGADLVKRSGSGIKRFSLGGGVWVPPQTSTTTFNKAMKTDILAPA